MFLFGKEAVENQSSKVGANTSYHKAAYR